MIKWESALLPGALVGCCAVGYYACRIWEKSLKLEQHKLYVNSTIKLIDMGLNKLGS
jgi:hypothetical protein